jgi:predicted LPLAT superfamily acyltransferase
VQVLEQLRSYNITVVVVNDGSSDETPARIAEACSRFAWLISLSREVNGGKGAAVLDGLRWALQNGFTHALLVDSDGQHSCSDVLRFLDIAAARPDALILGNPVFASDAPLARRIGREVSNVLTALVTLRCAARDVLCGFRVYPLGPLFDAVDFDSIKLRMGFDVDLVVRCLWAGMEVENVPTAVVYPEDGVSHFRYGADNIEIARLFAKRAINVPYFIYRRVSRRFSGKKEASSEWFWIRERGSVASLRVLLRILEAVGRRPLYVLMAPIVLFLFVWDRTSRHAAFQFQRAVLRNLGREAASSFCLWRAFRQFWEFGVSMVDKVVSWREGIPLRQFTWSGRDEVKARLANGQGLIMIGAHVGNLEVIRALGDSRQVMVNALMFTGNSRHFKALLEEVNHKAFVRVVDISSMDPSIVFDLNERLRAGEVVALLVDRLPKNSWGRSVRVEFLGVPAPFPEGPWILASLLDAPVYSVFSMRERGGNYRVEFELLAEKILLPRANRSGALKGYAIEFAQRLSATVMRYPYQWFNFFDFWKHSEEKRRGACR